MTATWSDSAHTTISEVPGSGPATGTPLSTRFHVAERSWGQGIGRALLEALIRQAKRNGLHVMVAGIDADNHESIRFHERLGFTISARMPEVGTKFGRWLELVLMQRTLDGGAPDACQPM